MADAKDMECGGIAEACTGRVPCKFPMEGNYIKRVCIFRNFHKRLMLSLQI